METNRHFSVYDFLGYIIPGIVVLYLSQYLISDFYDDKSNHFLISDYSNFTGSIDQMIIFLCTSYIIGHAINYLSSITIKQFSIWMFGYPSYFLLNINKPRYLKNQGSYTFRSCFWRITLCLIMAPIFISDWIFGRILGLRSYYTNQMDLTLRNIVIDKLMNNGIKTDDNNNDFQRILNHYYYENKNQHRPKFDSNVALAGFARSLSLVFNIFSILYIFNNHIMTAIVLLLLSYVFFMAFMKFYRRFSVEGFMCFILDTDFKINLT